MSDVTESICKNTSTRFGKQRYAIAKFSLQMYIQYHIRHSISCCLFSGGNSVSEVWGGGGGGQSFTNFRQHYIALLGLRLHIALRKPL